MRWHVAALTAVWLILGWCGSPVITQPVLTDGNAEDRQEQQQQILPSADLWSLLVEPSLTEDQTAEDVQVYQPSAAAFNYLLDPRWFLDQSRTKRQNNHHHHHNSRSTGHSGPMPQLSVSSPIDVLRSRLKLEMARRAANRQIEENQLLLKEKGKRRKRSAPRRTDNMHPAEAATVP